MWAKTRLTCKKGRFIVSYILRQNISTTSFLLQKIKIDVDPDNSSTVHKFIRRPGTLDPGLRQIPKAGRDVAPAEGGRASRADLQPVHHDAGHP